METVSADLLKQAADRVEELLAKIDSGRLVPWGPMLLIEVDGCNCGSPRLYPHEPMCGVDRLSSPDALPEPYAAWLSVWGQTTGMALVALLRAQAKAMEDDSALDSPDCPNCGTVPCHHPEALWCGRCDKAIESKDYTEDPCKCWTEVLDLARNILRHPIAKEQP